MSGFSPAWLALRAPADDRARDAALRARVVAQLGAKPCRLIDLGCGSGANLRALAPFLPDEQVWRLVDYDADLLAAARTALIGWADSHTNNGDVSRLVKDGKRIAVSFAQIDLANELEAAFATPGDLIVATAFFDLVSAPWIARFCAALAARRLPLYTTLTYTGEESWSPPNDDDAAMLAAFHTHQARDKGFGSAAGPAATALLERELRAHDYVVETAPSPWLLDSADAEMIAALARGSAQAVAETKLLSDEAVARWREDRIGASRCEIVHADLFGWPSKA